MNLSNTKLNIHLSMGILSITKERLTKYIKEKDYYLIDKKMNRVILLRTGFAVMGFMIAILTIVIGTFVDDMEAESLI